nr:hypothetical protein 2 [Mute swan feces associated picorna-like virus 28]
MFIWKKPPPVNYLYYSSTPPGVPGGTPREGLIHAAVDAVNCWFCVGQTLILNVLSIYALCLVTEYFKPSEIVPEAEDGNLPIGQDSTMSQEQNVKFVNTHPGYVQSVPSAFDSLRDDALTGDASLDEFFSRPIRIATYSWAVNADLFQTFNPWSLYLENKRVINRICNYRLMRCKLHVRFTINGNGFYYGRAMCSYNPFPNHDTLTQIRQFFEEDLIAASQRPHIFLNPTLSQGGDLLLPFFTFENVLDVVGQTWRDMGTINIKSMQNLQHANGATTPVTVNVFAWAEDVKFAIPTQFEPGAITPQADEYSKGPVSRVAGAIASKAGMLVTAPVIGPYARATELGAQCIGAVATLFGYSKPQILDVSMFQPKTKSNLAVTNAPEDGTKLSLDIKQELSVDPRTAGLGSQDELSINYIASRESFITSFPWNIGQIQEALLFNMIVDPCVYAKLSAEYHFPACCYATMPFKYWRGSLKYRFQVVCSNFHKGRLKIVYDPVGTPPTGAIPPTTPSAEYNTAYTSIVDISDNTDFEIDVGWGQNTTYREHYPFPNNAEPFSTTALTYDSSVVNYGNGTISVYVVNELTTPNSAAAYNIAINVFVSAGYGFEVAAPTDEYVCRVRYVYDNEPQGLMEASKEEPSNVAQAASALVAMKFSNIQPEALDGQDQLVEDSPPTLQSAPLDTMGNVIDSNDPANLVYFGETVSSMRQLLKRYNLTEIVTPADEPAVAVGTQSVFEMFRYSMPLIGGVYDSPYSLNEIVLPVYAGTFGYVYAFPSMLHYVSLAYGGWKGGIRYFVDFSTTTTGSLSGATVDRIQTPSYPANFLASVGDLLTLGPLGGLYNRFREHTGIAGTAIQTSLVNPTLSFECPYYSQYRFAPAKRLTQFDKNGFSEPDQYQNGWVLRLKGGAQKEGTTLNVYASAAEDFNAFFFLGCPRVYAEVQFPTL